ncbi:Lipase [Popillia japonica]|uniref:Lipase n=1 Tax=Popillia japonica TaxID=7064 RepID=A0AAW1LWV4_POPJA
MKISYIWIILLLVLCISLQSTDSGIGNILDIRYWSCRLKKTYSCPDNDIKFYLYVPEDKAPIRKRIDVRNPLALKIAGFNPHRKSVLIIHGFNGTESKTPMTTLRNAYLFRGDHNVFTVDYQPIARFPCYLSALSNTRLVGQCAAQLYAYIMDLGGRAEKTMCVGHSLGAHICGMMSNHLTKKQHRIIGLDPARPLISRFATREFRLTTEDAHQVEVFHTNAGILGEVNRIGHVDFCINGGTNQPGCKGHKLKRARCSHFQSVCFFAATVRGTSLKASPCASDCPKRKNSWGLLPGRSIPMGYDTPFTARGSYCIKHIVDTDCPFN